MKRTLPRILAMPLFVALFFTLLTGPGVLEVPFTLLFGWPWSIGRSFKAMHPQPGGLILFLLTAILLVAGTHVFLRWLHGTLRSAAADNIQVRWRWKWTICGYGMVLCTLIAIGSAVLTVHQIYWICKSPDPVIVDPFRERLGAMSVAMTLRKEVEEAQWESSKTRSAFWQQQTRTTSAPAQEELQFICVAEEQERLRAVILVPRRPMHRGNNAIFVIQPGTNLIMKHRDELPQVLASFGIGDSAQSAKAQTTTP
jgi:hypothetical protein